MNRRPSFRPTLPLIVAALMAACGGGGTDTSTGTGTGIGMGGSSDPATGLTDDGRQTALAATTRLAVPLRAPADPSMTGLSIPADAATRGLWGPVQDWPMNAIHAALLPDGKVLSYGAPENANAQDGRTFSVWTPSLGFGTNAHAVSFNASRVNSFCSTADWLGDGRLLISGGNTPRGSSLYTAATLSSTTDSAQLADERWYATMLAMPDGRAVMLGGIDPYTEGMYRNPDAAIAAGQVSMTPEVYTPGTGWRSLTGATSRLAFGPDHLRASYPRAWVAPGGEVFGISADQMWWLDVTGADGNGVLRSAGTFKGAPSASTPRNVGATNSAVMFAPGRILQMGGNGSFNGDGLPASDMATVVDINGTAPVLAETARMSAPRRFPSATVMPNGHVLVTGGTRRGNNGGADAVYAAESWSPSTGQWTPLASANRIRVYHSGALLLPNGTVLSLGGGTPGPVFNQNVEVFYPPYLFRSTGSGSELAPRPVMTGINALSHRPGGSLQVEMRDRSAVSRLVLVRGGTVTHSFNNGQRFVELAFRQTGDLLNATLPASGNTLTPGVWQLFALDAAGVPSQAAVITIQPGASVLPRDVPLALAASHVADTAMAVDAANLGVLGPLPGLPSAAQSSAARFIVRAGLADGACVSLEHAAQPGQWLRHQGYRLRLSANDGSALFRNDATFCPEPGLAGHSVTLRSRNFPGHVLRERDGQLWIDPQADDARFRNSATWTVRTLPLTDATPLPTLPVLPAAPVPAGSGAVRYAPGQEAAGLSFSWSFGDGSPDTPFSPASAITKTWATPGVYTVTLTIRNQAGQTAISRFVQAVHAPVTASASRSSSAMLLEPRAGASARLWVANPDQDNVAVFDATTMARIAIVTVGAAPRSIDRAPDGSLWVVNSDSASISVISPATLAVTRTLPLPRASQPRGLVFAPNGSAAWVTLGAAARLLSLDPVSGAQRGAWATGAEPRGLAISGDSARLLVSRFVTAPLPGEGTGTVTTTGNVGGEVWAYNTASMATPPVTVWLRHSDRTDNEIQGSGVPNYVGAPAISPDGRSAWVPSKQDNIRRGTLRNRQNLDFQNTVRAVSSRLDLSAAMPVELTDRRVDHDNASLAAAAVHDPTGAYLFVALETSRQVAVLDAVRGAQLARVEVELAPQALAVSPDGRTLYVQNFMSRTVSRVDLTPLMTQGRITLPAPLVVSSIATERLSPAVLSGKQLFYDARDERLSLDSYMSCATCHNDGGHDGRTWDLTGLGEGLRNTPSLRGRAGLGHGAVHWSGNFDEIQDFEGQIRTLAGGRGLMRDADFQAGTRRQPLGDRKTGLSPDLDALAAYVGSLNQFAPSPNRNADGSLTAAAVAGRAVFQSANCASCHGGAAYTAGGLRDIGTLKSSSGQRLSGSLTGIDVPTLRDVWATGPYFHDGSAATLEAAVQGHRGNTVAGADLSNLVAYLRQIGAEEGSAPGPSGLPPPAAVACAAERSTCTLPAGTTATVWYGANASWVARTGVTGSIACTNAVFGDPLVGTVKACRYVVTGTATPPANGTGLRGSYFATNNLSGAVRVTRTEAVDFNWGGGSPSAELPADNFSARWEGRLEAPATGAYAFQTNSDDGVRVWINGVLVIDNWTVHPPTLDTSGSVALTAGQRATVRIEYQEFGGGAVIQFRWRPPGGSGFTAVPANRLYLP